MKEDIIDQYRVEAGKVEVNIKICGGKGIIPSYKVIIPEFGKATLALLDDIRRELVTEVAVSAAEILDPKVVRKLKIRFRRKAELLLKAKLPGINEEAKRFLAGRLLHEILGLGKIEFLLADPQLEEVVINSAIEPVRIYHKKHGWLETNIYPESEAQIQNYSNIIARRVGRQITTLNPLLDAHLVTGDRANAVLSPICTKGNVVTIRMFARDPWTVTDLIENKTCTSSIFALIWLAMEYEMNILISGGTASGKTSFLNVCMPFIPLNHRIISIEDTRELNLPKYLYWCPLTTREPNPEGKGEVSMLDLLVNSLRMRPDRIILGEIRKQRQAEVLFEAMHTGHSVYATVHADSLGETIRRLVNPPINVAPNLLGAVNLNVVMFRDRRRGIRRIFQIGEFIIEEKGTTIVKPNLIYRWKPTTDEIISHNPSIRLFEDLSRHTGMSQTEINKDLASKKAILEYMVKNKVREMENVGKLMREYYLNRDFVINAVNKKLKPSVILK